MWTQGICTSKVIQAWKDVGGQILRRVTLSRLFLVYDWKGDHFQPASFIDEILESLRLGIARPCICTGHLIERRWIGEGALRLPFSGKCIAYILRINK